MDCPLCHANLPQTAGYCVQCGTPLRDAGTGSELALAPSVPAPRRCPSCHFESAPASRHCTSCGVILPNTPPASAGAGVPSPLLISDELRVVTVLQADLCGFTRIAERQTPEQTRALIGDLFDVLAGEITTNGGRVDAYIGDAILAVFGAPFSHGDDSLRAVDTALAMHLALSRFSHPLLAGLDTQLQMRIGIDTGPVIVGAIGTDRRTTVTGAAVAAAMELEQEAPPGGCLIGESTRRLVEHRFRLATFSLPSGRSAHHVLGIAPARLSLERQSTEKPSVQPGSAMLRQPDTPSECAKEMEHLITRAGDAGGGDLAQTQPDSLRSLVQARIDRLPFEEKRVIKAASVAGMRFWLELLERLGAPAPARSISSLVSRGFIRPRGQPTIADTSEYEFVSEVVRDVAYQTNLKKVRRFVHRVVAAWLEERVGSDIEIVTILAHHHAAGGDAEAAARVLMAAAQRAKRLHASGDAAGLYRGALSFLESRTTSTSEAEQLMEQCQDALAELPSPEGT